MCGKLSNEMDGQRSGQDQGPREAHLSTSTQPVRIFSGPLEGVLPAVADLHPVQCPVHQALKLLQVYPNQAVLPELGELVLLVFGHLRKTGQRTSALNSPVDDPFCVDIVASRYCHAWRWPPTSLMSVSAAFVG